MLEALDLRPLFKMHQAHDSSLDAAIPKTPLRVVDLRQRMSANPTSGNRVDPLRDLLAIHESPRDVEPIQYVVSMWRGLPLNGPQACIAIAQCSSVLFSRN
jgi:hypothetical protein